jgi:hypothetical protein
MLPSGLVILHERRAYFTPAKTSSPGLVKKRVKVSPLGQDTFCMGVTCLVSRRAMLAVFLRRDDCALSRVSRILFSIWKALPVRLFADSPGSWL